MTKESDLGIRVQRDGREKFLRVYRAEDKAVGQVIRKFMRSYIDRQEKAGHNPDSDNNQRQGLSCDY